MNVTVDMLKWFSLPAQLVRGISMGTQRWSCDGRIPNVTLHLRQVDKNWYFLSQINRYDYDFLHTIING